MSAKFLKNLLGEASHVTNAPAKPGKPVSSPIAHQRPVEFPVPPTHAAPAESPRSGVASSTIGQRPSPGRSSGRETSLNYGSSVDERTRNHGRTASHNTTHRLPPQRSTLVGNSYRPHRHHSQEPREARAQWPPRPRYTVVENSYPQYSDDRTGVQCDYGIATPYDNPAGSGCTTSPVADDYRVQSPDMTEQPKADRIVRGRIEKRRRASPNLQDSSAANPSRHYSLRKDNIIPIRPNPQAKPNRYGRRYVIDPSLLERMFTWVESHPDDNLIKKSVPSSSKSYTRPKAGCSAPWTLAGSFDSQGEAFQYDLEADVADCKGVTGAASVMQTAPKVGNAPIDVDKICADLLKPHPKLQAQAEAAKQSLVNGQESRSERHSSYDSFRPGYGSVQDRRRLSNVPTRFRYLSTYKALSVDELQKEAELRRLNLDGDDAEYLAEVLIVDDKAFSDFFYGLEQRHLSTEQLRDEAIIKQADLDTSRHYSQPELLAAIAIKFGRNAVDMYNQQLRRQKAAELQAANERARKKQRHERARKAQEIEAEKAKSNAAELVAAAAPKPRSKKPKQKGEEHVREGSQQHSDSGYSTSNAPSPPVLSSQGSHHELPAGGELKGKKRSRVDDGNDKDAKLSKKIKTSPKDDQPPRTIKPPRPQAPSPPVQLTRATEEDSDSDLSEHPSDTEVDMSDVEQQVDSDNDIRKPGRKNSTQKIVEERVLKPGTAIVKGSKNARATAARRTAPKNAPKARNPFIKY